MSAVLKVKIKCDYATCRRYLQTPCNSEREARTWAGTHGWDCSGRDFCPAHVRYA